MSPRLNVSAENGEFRDAITSTWMLFLLLIAAAKGSAADARAPSDDRPNILFAIADDWSFGHAGAYACPWVETPAFDRVAREGLLFQRAFTPNAKCAPCRASILTGRYSWQLKDACNHVCRFPNEFKSYAESLAEAGYVVGSTGKTWGPGIAQHADGSPRKLAGNAFNRRQRKPITPSISNNDYASNFVDFLESVPQGAPWCFWYGALEPHRRYEYGSGVAKADKQLSQIDRVPAYLPDNEQVRNDLLDYALEVEHFDQHLGQMLASLQGSGLIWNTIVVVTSDHGMPFPRAKGQAYFDSNHLPLAIMWPQGIRAAGRQIDDFVTVLDFAPTFLELAQVDWLDTGMAPLSGRSLTDIFRSEHSGQIDPHRDHVVIGKERHDVGRPHDVGYPIRGVITSEWLYLRNFKTDRWPAGNPETGYLNCDGSPSKTSVLQLRTDPEHGRFWQLCFGLRPAEELYQLTHDSDCVVNLASRPDYESVKSKLQARLHDDLRDQGDPRIFGGGDRFDQIPYVATDTAGFYERYGQGERVRAGWVNATDFEDISEGAD